MNRGLAATAGGSLAMTMLLLGGCATSGSNPAAPTAVSGTQQSDAASPTIDYGQQYLDAVKPLNTTMAEMATKLEALPESATGPDAAKVMAPYVRVLRDTSERLLRMPWPDNVQADIKTLVTAEVGLAATLDSLATQNAFSIAQWTTQFGVDGGKIAAAVAIVRADLGLPRAGQ